MDIVDSRVTIIWFFSHGSKGPTCDVFDNNVTSQKYLNYRIKIQIGNFLIFLLQILTILKIVLLFYQINKRWGSKREKNLKKAPQNTLYS